MEQRRIGIQQFLREDSAEWLLFLDDDIELRSDALEKLAECAQVNEPSTVGIALRIEPSTSRPRHRTLIARNFGIIGSKPGSVALSGENVAYAEADDGASLQWAAGGATAWKRSVLETHQHPRFPDRYAFLEDVIFSYPISQSGTITYCSRAVADHMQIPTTEPDFRTARDKGLIAGLHGAYFVWANPQALSKWRFSALLWPLAFGV